MALKSIKEWKICKCPNCEKKYKKKIFYTGRARFPPYRCSNCISEERQILSDESKYDHSIPEDLLTK